MSLIPLIVILRVRRWRRLLRLSKDGFGWRHRDRRGGPDHPGSVIRVRRVAPVELRSPNSKAFHQEVYFRRRLDATPALTR
jgi:hypothetical protein